MGHQPFLLLAFEGCFLLAYHHWFGAWLYLETPKPQTPKTPKTQTPNPPKPQNPQDPSKPRGPRNHRDRETPGFICSQVAGLPRERLRPALRAPLAAGERGLVPGPPVVPRAGEAEQAERRSS